MTGADPQISATDRNAALAPNGSAVRGLSHLTLAVRDRDRSVAFDCDLLCFTLVARYPKGAYLEAGSLWLTLHVDDGIDGQPRHDYTHFAFDVDHAAFDRMAPLNSSCRDRLAGERERRPLALLSRSQRSQTRDPCRNAGNPACQAVARLRDHHKINRLKSPFFARSPTWVRT